MALLSTQYPCPTGLVLGDLTLNKGLECRQAKKDISAGQIFRRRERFLAWGLSWGGPLLLRPTGSEGIAIAQKAWHARNLIGYGGKNQGGKRLYLQHQNGIPASKSGSSSSLPGSPGVGAAKGQVNRAGQYDEGGKPTDVKYKTSFTESESLSGGWESEQDLMEAVFAERDHRSREILNGGPEEFVREADSGPSGEILDDGRDELWERRSEGSSSNESSSSGSLSSTLSGASTAGSKEPVFEVIEVSQLGKAVKRLVSRRQLLRTSGLRLRDLRRVDPSLWVTNSAPALLVRDQAILLNLGSLRAIATTQEVLIFDHNSVGAQAFIETLIPRLNDHNNGSGSIMPFELEVIEAALISRTQRLERGLMDVEPRVIALLEVLPTRMTADILEELRLSKQALVEVGAKAGALRQMLLELLEHPQDIRRMVIMGRICDVSKEDGNVDCALAVDKQVAEDEEEEMEMLLEYYLQRCESCHGQALKLLSSAKEMEDSIAVNLSSRRLEVSRLELLLQVGTFCAALGALVAGIFGMNLKSYLEERVMAFWFTTGGIIFGGIALFIYMFTYLSDRKIL